MGAILQFDGAKDVYDVMVAIQDRMLPLIIYTGNNIDVVSSTVGIVNVFVWANQYITG